MITPTKKGCFSGVVNKSKMKDKTNIKVQDINPRASLFLLLFIIQFDSEIGKYFPSIAPNIKNTI